MGGPLLIAVVQRIPALDVRITYGQAAEVRYSLRWQVSSHLYGANRTKTQQMYLLIKGDEIVLLRMSYGSTTHRYCRVITEWRAAREIFLMDKPVVRGVCFDSRC